MKEDDYMNMVLKNDFYTIRRADKILFKPDGWWKYWHIMDMKRGFIRPICAVVMQRYLRVLKRRFAAPKPDTKESEL